MSNDLLERAQRLVNEYGAEELLSIELTNITPALVGSWNATRYTDPDSCLVEPPRPTDIAGKTRWWLRAILAAGIYEKYGLHAPTYLLDEIASQIMGSAGDKGHASKIQIITEPLSAHQAAYICYDTGALLNPTRVRDQALSSAERLGVHSVTNHCTPLTPEECCRAALLSSRVLLSILDKKDLPKTKKIPLPPGFYRFRLRVLWRPGSPSIDDELEQRLLGLALGLALFFTGIGRMTTRGYGKLAIIGSEEYSPATVLAKDVDDVFYILLNNDHALHMLSEKATDYAKEYIESLTESRSGQSVEEMIRSSNDVLPSIPLQETLHENYIVEKSLNTGCIRLRWVERSHECYVSCENDPWCIVAAISEAVKKTSIKHMILRRYVHGTGLGIPSYILGLPRKGTRITAKRFSKDYERLVSQIHFSPIGSANTDSHTIGINLRRLVILGFNSVLSSPLDLQELGYIIKYNPGSKTINKLCGANLYAHDYADCLRLLKIMHDPSISRYSDGILQAALEASMLLNYQCSINLAEFINIIIKYLTES